MFYLIATVGWFFLKQKTVNNETNPNLGVKYKDVIDARHGVKVHATPRWRRNQHESGAMSSSKVTIYPKKTL